MREPFRFPSPPALRAGRTDATAAQDRGVLLSIEVASIIGDEGRDLVEFPPLVLPWLAADVGSSLWRRRYPVAVLPIVMLSALWAIFDPIGDGILPLLVARYSLAVWEPDRRHAAVAAVVVVPAAESADRARIKRWAGTASRSAFRPSAQRAARLPWSPRSGGQLRAWLWPGP